MVKSDEVTVAVRVKPGAGRDRVGGRHDGPHGPALVIAVRAPAVDGRATEAARSALAEALGVRRSAVALRTGVTSRDKLFIVAGPVQSLMDRIHALREEAAGAGGSRPTR